MSETRNDLALDPDAVPGVDEPADDDVDESETPQVVPPDVLEGQ